MDRSATPKVSQLPQSKRGKGGGRSRSGSEELMQILSNARGGGGGQHHHPMSASSSSSGISASATPVPEQVTSPGLLSWMRNALSTTSPARGGVSSSSGGITSPPAVVVGEDGGAVDPIKRRGTTTPLLPGILPSFHRRLSDLKDDEWSADQTTNSARSSLSIDAPSSAGNWSLEPYDVSQRRMSSVSTVSTTNDEDSSSSEEDVYVPYAAKQSHAPLLIRPTARRDAFPLGPPDDDDGFSNDQPSSGVADRKNSLERRPDSIEERTAQLRISEAQDPEQFVRDTSAVSRPPEVVLTPPDSSDLVTPTSPIAGWMNPFGEGENSLYAAPSSGHDVHGSDSKTPVPGHPYPSPVARSIASKGLGANVDEGEEGDGEDLNDHLGRPRSPSEVAKTRPSRESVVLGSRQASQRSLGGRKLSRNKQKNQNDGAKGDVAEREASKTPMPQVLMTESDPQTNQDSVLYGKDSAIVKSDPIQTAAPQPRRAMNFFTRRREASTASSGPERRSAEEGEETGSGAAGTNPKSTASNSSGMPFWKRSRKASNVEGSSPAVETQVTDDASLPQTARKGASKTSKRLSQNSEASQSDRGSRKTAPRATTVDSVDTSKGKELGSKSKSSRSAMDSSMQPRAIKVRTRHMNDKERAFSRLYLAQELYLDANVPCAASKDEAGSTSGQKPTLSHLDSTTSVASSVASSVATTQSGSGPGKRRSTWAMKFSVDGKYLAVAGQDAVIRVYAVLENSEARMKLEKVIAAATARTSLAASLKANESSASVNSSGKNGGKSPNATLKQLPNLAVFASEPVREFKGHSADILDLSWSKGGFLLSASMDKTARVWHLSWPNSLVSFVHGDFVTSAAFHPRDDRFFLSGSLDGKLRLWNIPAKKVQCSQEVPGLITACAFTESGSIACAGTFAGHALFYQTEGLTYSSSIAVRSPSGKHAKGGRKITAIEPLHSHQASTSSEQLAERVLITSNDSRVRAYSIRDKSLIARFKAKTYLNRTSQIRAALSDDNTFIVAGSEGTHNEGGQVHIWDSSQLVTEVGKKLLSKVASSTAAVTGKGSSNAVSSDSAVEYFTAHAGSVTCAIMAPLATNSYLSASGDYIMQQCEKRSVAANGVKVASSPLGPLSISNALSAAVSGPLRIGASGNSDNGALSISRKQNRIVLSVDENAVVRVWRSDSLLTVE